LSIFRLFLVVSGKNLLAVLLLVLNEVSVVEVVEEWLGVLGLLFDLFVTDFSEISLFLVTGGLLGDKGLLLLIEIQ